MVPAGRVALGLRVDEEHAEDVGAHQEQHQHSDDIDEHWLVLPRNGLSDASPSAGIGRTISRRRRRPSG